MYMTYGKTALVQNCTIYSNTALSTAQGGFRSGAVVISTPVLAGSYGITIRNSTIVSNATPNGQSGGLYAYLQSAGREVLESTIIASNTCAAGAANSPDVCITNTVSSVGVSTVHQYNFIGNNQGSIISPIGTEYAGTSASPLESGLNWTLQNNGGPTPTLALLSTSICIGHGTNSVGILWDQRERPYQRTVNGLTDIGAIQLNGLSAAKASGGTVMFFK